MRKITRLWLALGVAGAALAVAGSGSGAGAAFAEESSSIVEDYAYPDADRIRQERGIRLVRGDGRIVLTDCGPTGLIEVWSRAAPTQFCFRVKGAEGLLVLELDLVYAVKGGSQQVTAKVTVDGETETVPVPPETWVGVGEGNDPNSGPATLVELRA